MKVEWRLFLGLAVFCWLAAAGYGIWTSIPNSYSHGHLEPIGVAALVLSGGLLGIPGGFFWFVSRRIDARPEDRPDAEVAEAAGDYGFFSPGSYWPVALAAAATVVGLALAFVQVWLIVVGVIGLMLAVGGLLFEYYIGGRHPFGS